MFDPEDYDVDEGNPRELHTMTFEERQAERQARVQPPPITFLVNYLDAVRLTWWLPPPWDSEDGESWSEGWHRNEFGDEHEDVKSTPAVLVHW